MARYMNQHEQFNTVAIDLNQARHERDEAKLKYEEACQKKFQTQAAVNQAVLNHDQAKQEVRQAWQEYDQAQKALQSLQAEDIN